MTSRTFDIPADADDVRAHYTTTEDAAARLGVAPWTIQEKCKRYRRRIEAIQAEGREPTPAECAPKIPHEMECQWFGHGKGRLFYLVKKAQLDGYPVNRPGPDGKRGRGRPAGVGRGKPIGRRKPRHEDRRFRDVRAREAKSA
jgi:hypothetical protein